MSAALPYEVRHDPIISLAKCHSVCEGAKNTKMQAYYHCEYKYEEVHHPSFEHESSDFFYTNSEGIMFSNLGLVQRPASWV